MSLYKDPRSTILHLLEVENNITLDSSDYDFSAPTPSSPPDGSDASYNTALTISNNNPAAPYIGEVEVYYNRLNLADLKVLADIYVHSPDINTTHEILPSLNRRYGLNLTVDDVEDLPTDPYDGYRIAHLKAKSDSIGWIGEIDIGVVEGDLILEDHLTEVVLGGLNYPTEDLTRTFAHFYSYWRNFSDHHEFLRDVKRGDEIGLDIISILNDVTGDPWVGSGTSEFSLDDAEIVFSGSTSDYPSSNDDYDYLVVIALDPEKCTGMSGSLILHHTEDPYATLGI